MVSARLIGGALLAVTVALDVVSAVQSDDTRFRVTVLQSTARRPEAGDISRVLARADDLLGKKTGEHLVRLAFEDVGRGVPIEKVQAYIKAHPDAVPDGFLILSDDDEAVEYGAYSFVVPRPEGSHSRFPNSEGDGFVYAAVVDLFHKPSRSRGPNGEFDYMRACMVVHEFAHAFGDAGDDDHYRGSVCAKRMNFSPAERTEIAAQENCGMCPDVLAKFRRAK